MHILLQKYFSFIKGFLPKPDVEIKTSIGLDLGSSQFRYVEISKTKETYSIVGWGAVPSKPTDYTETVRSLLDQIGHPPENIYSAIAGKGTLIRYINMPKMSVEEARQSFAIESEKYFPFSQDQIFTDCFVLNPESSEENVSLMAAASKKELVNGRIELFNEIDVKSDFIGINSVALANAVSTLGVGIEVGDNAAVAILDLGDQISSLTILHKNVPQFSRDIYVGGLELTKRIGNSLGIQFDAAQALKLNPGDRLEDVLTACESPISNVIQEVRLSFDYFMSEKNIEVSHLLLTGGSSRLSGLIELFRQHLEIEVELFNPLKVLEIAEGVDKKAIEDNISKLGVAIGLALYHYD